MVIISYIFVELIVVPVFRPAGTLVGILTVYLFYMPHGLTVIRSALLL